jgi:uncharacterized protein (TIGR02145 family)
VGGDGGFARKSILNLNANGNVGINNATPNASAQLDVTSTTGGFLPPRMTTIQMSEILTPAEGLIVYCLDCMGGKGLRLFDGASWVNMAGASPAPASFTFTGGNFILGDFFAGKVFSAKNSGTIVLPINVTAAGSIKFSSTTINGYSFTYYGEFPNTGNYNVNIKASGTQTAFNAGGDAYTFTGIGTTTQTTTVTIPNVQNGASFTSFSNGTENFSANTTCASKGISTTLPANCPASVTVGSTTYNAVNINGQCWMHQNLKEAPTTGPCTAAPNTGCNSWTNTASSDLGRWGYYNTSVTSGSNGWRTSEPGPGEGLLYQWSAAMNGVGVERSQGVCPTGWHVPSDCEFMYLEHGLGMTIADQNLGATGAWRGSGSVGQKLKSVAAGGTDAVVFNGLLSGRRNANNGAFTNRNANGMFWTSTFGTNRYLQGGTVNEIFRKGNESHALAMSIRCLKDN